MKAAFFVYAFALSLFYLLTIIILLYIRYFVKNFLSEKILFLIPKIHRAPFAMLAARFLPVPFFDGDFLFSLPAAGDEGFVE